MIKTILFLFFQFFFFTFLTQGQEVYQNKVDSIRKLLEKTQVDSIRINQNLQIADLYIKFNPEKSLYFLKKANEIALKTNSKKGLADYYRSMCRYQFTISNYTEAVNYALRANDIYKQIKNNLEFLNCAYELSSSYYRLNNINAAIQTIETTLKFCKNTKHYNELGNLYLFYGGIMARQNNYKLAYNNYTLANYYFRKENNSNSILNLYKEMIYIYINSNQNQKALDYANKIRLELNKNKRISVIRKSILFTTIAIAFTKNNKFEEAIYYLSKSDQTIKSTSNKTIEALNLHIYSDVYFRARDYNKSLFYCEKLIKNYGETNYIINAYAYKAKILYIQKKIIKAAFFQNKAIELLNKNNQKNHETDTYDGFYKDVAKTNFELGNLKSAYLFLEKDADFQITKLKQINESKVQELQAKLELDQKNSDIKRLLIKNQLEALKLQRQKNYFIVVSSITIVLIIVLLFIIWLLKKTKKQSSIIAENNIQIEKNIAVKEQLIKEKEILLREIHHRVKNNFQLVISLLNIQAEEGAVNDVATFLEISQGRIRSMSLIHQNLYESENMDKVDFRNFTQNLVNNLVISASITKDINFIIDVEVSFLEIQKAIPLGLIINELIWNVFKHAFNDANSGEVLIQLNHTVNNFYTLTFADNGSGINNTKTDKKSLGLELVHLLVQQIQGEIEIDDTFGTKFIITFQD